MNSPYFYPIGLVIISAFVMALEFFFPWRQEQRQLRKTLPSDVIHLIFNGHFLGVILFGMATHHILPHLDAFLSDADLHSSIYRNSASDLSLWLQIPLALLFIDLLQWGVHNLLHRVPFLWRFHQTHHSVVDGEMDFIVSFRFQWVEVVIYKSILYLPMAWLGFSAETAMVHALFGTLIGHLNHSNLNISWGPLRYVLNNPRMHIWHHDYDGDAGNAVNFGIIFSCWDWIFRTAYLPEGQPRRIGFPKVEEFPKDFLGQTAWPLANFWRGLLSEKTAPWAGRVFGAGLLAAGWWLHLP